MLKPFPFRMAVILTAVALSLPSFAATPTRNPGFQAITKPSRDVVLSFIRPGRVSKILVGKGDDVKLGQLIAHQDDTEEQAALAIDKLQSEDMTEIVAEQAVLKQNIIDNDRIQKSSAAQVEKDKAALDVEIARARIKIAETKVELAKLKYQQSSIAIQKLNLLAPFDGIIADELIKAGENADGGNMKVVRLVQLDPLWIDVPVTIPQARQLKKDDPARVTFADGKLLVGKVAVVAPVGDSASETLLVRVEVPNPEKISSGENVFVNFGAQAVAKP